MLQYLIETDMVHSGALANPNCISEVMPITYFFVMFVRIAHLFLYHKQVYPAKSKTGNQTWMAHYCTHLCWQHLLSWSLTLSVIHSKSRKTEQVTMKANFIHCITILSIARNLVETRENIKLSPIHSIT